MKLLLILLFFCNTISAQVRTHNISDDGHVHIPLQFGFPLHGRIFTDSYMFSNGVVGFGSVNNHWCCSGYDLATNSGYQFNYSIMGLQTDLINYGSGRFLTEGTTQYQRYMWENISEFGRPNNLNTFGIEIRPSGYIGMQYSKVTLDRPFTIGVTGDTTLGEYRQFRHQNGLRTTEPFSYSLDTTGNICVTNPLASPSCPNYQIAYDEQQCSLNPLYRPSCVGYEEAYLSQQCNINSLFSPRCPNYETAYLAQQCNISQLYSTQCPNYAQAYHAEQCRLNPLYATTCQGYERAYYNQQCSLNPLYDSGCVGYEAAYFNQQCSRNPLYNSGCVGYAQAYFNYQCTQNPLYNSRCVGYEQAYFNEQCRLNPLYDRTCSGYAEAYAQQERTRTPIATPTVQTSFTGEVTIATPVIADPVVNTVVQRNERTQRTEPQAENKVVENKPTTKETAPKKQTVPSNTAVTNEIPKVEIKMEQPLILDMAFKSLVTKPIRDNNRSLYFLTITSQKTHEEMVDGQYRKRD